jgi:hypothetical protein
MLQLSIFLKQIADKELARKEELSKNLDYICHQVGQLGIVDTIPSDLEQRDVVINRAIDVRSAAMLYLALHIQHDATRLVIPGAEPVEVFVG